MGKYLIRSTLLAVALAPLGLNAQEESAPLTVDASVADLSNSFVEDTPLFLEVSSNGREVGLAAEFTAHPGENRLSAKRSELREIVVKGRDGSESRRTVSFFCIPQPDQEGHGRLFLRGRFRA